MCIKPSQVILKLVLRTKLLITNKPLTFHWCTLKYQTFVDIPEILILIKPYKKMVITHIFISLCRQEKLYFTSSYSITLILIAAENLRFDQLLI